MRVKRLETAVGSMVGGDGAIYAIRRQLWKGIPDTAINDFLNPLQIVEAGWRAVYEPEAVCYEETAGGTGREWRRRVRIVSRSWRADVPGAAASSTRSVSACSPGASSRTRSCAGSPGVFADRRARRGRRFDGRARWRPGSFPTWRSLIGAVLVLLSVSHARTALGVISVFRDHQRGLAGGCPSRDVRPRVGRVDAAAGWPACRWRGPRFGSGRRCCSSWPRR